ncbi:MAG: polymer-forming cytoskeletal protein, partial [Myxococcales bacterium]|nr:polymer-forming cytoskeletal protein [Myxococcales bacterium]
MRDETQPFVVASGLTIVGDIDAAGALRVEGSVRGRVFVRGTLTVAPGAVVEGFIQALDIEVFGRLSGVIRAETEVRLHADGEVTGDVEAPRVRFVKADRASIPPPAAAPAPATARPPAPPPAA